jgi:asparagine synthase (glutamine-hydrolysing)
VDRATMAVSIEGREPLLDHRLVEFAFRLPLSLRRGPLGTKHLLRKVLYRHVPRALIERPKMGFGIPLIDWLRSDLRHLIDQYLDPQSIHDQAILDARSVRKAVRRFRRGDQTSGNRLWSLLAFQLWREKWG